MKNSGASKTFCNKVDTEFYRAVHIRAAENGQTLQGYVCGLIRQDLQLTPALTLEQRDDVCKIATELQALSGELMACLEQMEPPQNSQVEEVKQEEGMILG